MGGPKTGERPWGIPRPAHYPGESRRVLGELETGSLRVEETEYAAGLCLGRHAHETAQFIYILEGTHWSGHSRGGDACPPGTLRYIPPGEPHENYFPTGSRCLGVALSQATLGLAREEGALDCPSGELASPEAAAQGARLHLEFRERDDLTAVGVETILLELLVEGVRPGERRSGPAPVWLRQIRELLYEQGARHLTLAELGRSARRHPVQVSRQFQRHFGCTISEYVRRVRVGRAQLLLAGHGMSVAEIALESGFADQSHFTNTFRRLTGMPPHRYRMESLKAGRCG